MKRSILILLILGFTIILKAQNYPLVKDGTTWEYLHTSLASYSRYCNVVDGDTTINERTYKKMYHYSTYRYDRMNAKFVCAFREEGNKIYALPDENIQYLPKENDEVILYDFSLKEGDVYLESDRGNGYTVDKVDYVDIDGKQCKRISFSGWDEWIEGVGSLRRAFGYPLSDIPSNGSSTTLEMLEQDGKVLYGSNRFNLLSDGVHWTERTSTDGNVDETGKEIFELQHFSVNGDSIINGVSYKKVYLNDYPYMNLREDENGNIYYYNPELKKDGLLYQFDPQLLTNNDLHFTDDSGKDRIIAKGVEYVPNLMYLPDGHRYVYYTMSESSYDYQKRPRSEKVYLIFGVGLTQGIFQHILTRSIDCVCFNDLVSIYNNENKLVYQNPTFKENGEFVSGISSAKSENKLLVTIQKGEATFNMAEFSQSVAPVVYIYGIDGSLVSTRSLETGNTTVTLPVGTYVYRLYANEVNTETGKFLIGK